MLHLFPVRGLRFIANRRKFVFPVGDQRCKFCRIIFMYMPWCFEPSTGTVEKILKFRDKTPGICVARHFSVSYFWSTDMLADLESSGNLSLKHPTIPCLYLFIIHCRAGSLSCHGRAKMLVALKQVALFRTK